ncbi:hypothetical protein Tco_0896955 [Tanacetum coccineum]
MNTTQAQQKALDDALVAPADRLESSIRFTINKKKVSLDVDIFKDILQFCPKIPGQVFEDLPLEQGILSFIRDLRHTGEITYLTDVNVDCLHQPWRAFSTVINKCISGKETRMDKIRLSHAQILWDMKILREKAPKPKYIRKKANSDTSPKKKPVQATKSTRLKSKAKVAKQDKKKQPAKKKKAKGLAVLSKVALSEVEQLKLATKRSKKDFHMSHTSGSGDGVNIQSKKELGGDSKDGDDNDDDGNNDDDGDSDDHDDDTNDERTESDREEIPDPKKTNEEHNKEEEEYDDEFNIEEEEKINDEETVDEGEDDEVTKELYDDVNVNLGNEYTDMTIADQEATPTPTPTTSETTTSLPTLPDFASVFKFNERFFNLEKDVSKIKQVNQYAQALSSIPAIVDRYMDNKLGEAINKAILAHNLDCRQEVQDEKNAYIELVVSDFATHVIEKNFTESVEAAVLTRSSSQPTSTYEAATSLSEFELIKILIDKMEKNNEVFLLKRSRDEDKDRDPSARSDRGKKRRKSSKDVDSSIDSRLKEKKSSSTSKDFKKPERPPTPDPDWSKRRQVDFQPPQTWISQVARAKEPPTSFDKLTDTSFDFSAFVLNRLKILNLTQEILVGPAFNLLKGTCKSIIELEYHLEECSKATTEQLDWHNPKNKPYPFDLRKPLLLIQDHQGRQIIPKTKATTYDLKWIEDLVQELWSPRQVKYDQHAYFGTSHWGPKCQSFYGYASNLTSSKDVYSRKRIIAVTRLTIMKKYDYGHLEEIEVRRDDQKLYTFKEGDFKRLRLQYIEDMLLLLIQQKLTNLIIDERYILNVALCMFTRRIVIQRQVEDLQLGVESYQKKLNLMNPDTFRSNLRKRTTYTAYSNPKGVIYKEQMNRNRLMRADELHKFSDGTLDDVRSALNDIAKGIRIQNRRDLPRDIPLDSVVVLKYEKRSKSEYKGRVPTEMELVLDQTQQGTSYEVSVSAEGVKELKRKVKIKGEKKEALLTLR